MFQSLIILLTVSSISFGLLIVEKEPDSYGGFGNLDFSDNDDQCSNLTPELIKEIKSHQQLVDQIVNAIVNGKYSGDTWNA